MLRIRSDQVHLFGQLRREAVVRELVRDIGVFAPKLADVIGEEGRSIAACTALDVAQRHGFVRPSSARLILQLMASLGVEFTTDPQLPWASEILYRTRDQPEETRRQRLYRRAVAFMDEVHGENNRNAIQALQRMFPDDASLTPRVPANLEGFVQLAARVYPEKAEFVARGALTALYEQGAALAAQHHLGAQSTMLLASLAFALGSGIFRDPFYPWILRTLTASEFGEGEARTRR